MEVRYNQETEGMVLKNGLKEGKDSKDSQGGLSKSFLKEQQDSFSPSGTLDNCEKNRGSTGDPDYCRRILVRDAKGSIREIILPKGLDLDRPKRTRTSFTAEQLYRLEMEFQRCQYVVGRERTELARQLNLSETQVKVWFQNRRTKQKKDQGKDSELRSVVSETAATCREAADASGFPMPSLLSGVATRISSNPLSMAGSLAGNLQELSARYLSSSAFEPYSRTNGKESMDKKILE
ncbi:hypothetical protein INR49_012402 [Caranx melampygus]|nr:hypothetical protein INR49_012402 [Caranx melampygus]